MKKRNLIFLCGFAGVGKDTVAEMINKMSYDNYDIVGFADALKTDYYKTVGVEYSRGSEDRAFKEIHRPGLINHGESMKHEKGFAHWIEAALDPLIFDKKSERGIIVPDCRRTEEMLWYADFLGGKLAKYQFVRDSFQPHFFTIHRLNADVEDKDYLTHVAIRVATELMFLSNRHIKNYKGLDALKKSVEEIYAMRLK